MNKEDVVMAKAKFKIGDRVDYVFEGIGRIIGIDLAEEENRDLEPYLVRFKDSGQEFWFSEEEIEEMLIKE